MPAVGLWPLSLLRLQVVALPGRCEGRQRAVTSAIQQGLAYFCSLVLRRTGAGKSGCASWPPCPDVIYMACGSMVMKAFILSDGG